MPSGKIHHEYHQKFLPAVAVGSATLFVVGIIVSSYISEMAVWMFFWYWSGRYIDPDWDLLGVTEAEGRMLRELGYLGVMFIPVTAFYAANIGYFTKKLGIKGAIGGTHGTWLTHKVIPGTLIRQSIICLVILFVVNSVNAILEQTFGGWLEFATKDLIAFLIGQFLGLAVSDTIHILLDKYYGGD